jgi:cytochrome P450
VPSVQEFQPFSRATLECPYPFYAAMRREAPVYQAAPNVYFVATYELVNRVLRDWQTFSSRHRAAFLNFQGEKGLAPPPENPPIPPALQELAANAVPPRDTLLSADPPAHTRFRTLVNRSLSPRRVARLEPMVRDVVSGLIDGFVDRGEVEFVREFSMLLPLTVVSEALGVPRADIPRFKEWSRQTTTVIARPVTPEERIEGLRATFEITQYLRDQVEAARRAPGENIIGDLVQAHILAPEAGEDGHEQHRALDTPEIVSIINQLLVAGQETVNYLTASLMLLLIEHPEQMAAVRANRALIEPMIEEGVRFESPIQALGRFCTRDTELAGVRIPEGARVVLLYGCANRDEGQFRAPAAFDVHREDVREHVGFGAGPHYCIGAALARLEMRVAFEELLQRLINIRLVDGRNDLAHHYNFIFRGLKELHLAFERA